MSRSVRANALMNGLRTVSTMVFPLVTFPYIARVLGPEGTGKVNFAWTFVGYFVLVAAIGIPYYGIREVAKLRDDPERLRDLTQELALLHLGASLLATLAFLVATLLTGKLVQEPWLYLVVSASILLSAAGVEWLYEGREEYGYITTRSVAFSFLSMGALFLFVHGKEDYVAYAAIGVAATLGSCLLNFWNARGLLIARRSSPWRLRRHFASIGALYVLGLLSSVYLTSDILFLGLLKGDHEVGLYAAATKLTKLVAGLLASAGAVLMPRLSYYVENGMHDEYRRMVGKSLAVTLLFSLPCVVGLVLLAPEIVGVLAGQEYAGTVRCLVITAPVLLLSSLAGILAWQVLYPKGGERTILWATTAAAVLSCGTNLFLVSHWGSTGAALALFLSEVLVLSLLWIPARKEVDLASFAGNVGRCLLGCLGMGTGLLVLRLLPMPQWLHLGLGVGVGGGLYLLLLLGMREPLALEFKDAVLRRLGRGGRA